MDAAWYLQPSPRKPEIQIGRTVLRVLGCRYQPAQLNLANMARQLTEAEVGDCSFLMNNFPFQEHNRHLKIHIYKCQIGHLIYKQRTKLSFNGLHTPN